MSITSVVNDLVTSVSVINALKPLPPTISGYSVAGKDDLALDPAGGQTVQINGTGFLPGATITFDGSAVAVVTYVNPNQLTFTSPAKTAGTYTIYAVNPDGGTAIYVPGIIYSTLPTWTTAAGSLGSYYETTSISNTVVAAGDAPVTYSLYSGSLPTGSTLSANGVITGTAPVDSSSTTYSFTIEAIDAQLQGSTRSFSLTINVDAVTWVSPANNTTYTSAANSAISTVALSATDAAGYAVSYSANALPTGLSLSGANITGTPTVIADSSTLLTATAATTNRTAVRTINWSITVANDIYFEYNTLLIPGASTTFVDDASTNNFAVTINGDTKPNNTNPYTPGYYSNYFDGTGDYLSTTSNAALNVGAGAFTVEAWIYPNTLTNYGQIVGQNVASNDYWMFTIQANGVIRQQNYFNIQVSSATGTIVTGKWQHVVLVRDGSNNLSIFVNGIRVANTTDSTNWVNTSVNYIGAAVGDSGYFNGYISNVRCVKGTAVYDPTLTTLTVPTTPLTAIANTSLLTCQSNRFIDNSTNNFTLTVNGNTSISSFDPFVPNSSYSTYGSGYFDGTGDYLQYPSDAAFQFGTGNFTIEFWWYPLTLLDFQPFVYHTNNNGVIGTGQFVIVYNTTFGLRFYSNSGSTDIKQGAITGWSVNQWYHVAIVRNSDTLTLYRNGTSLASGSVTGVTIGAAVTTQIMGEQYDPGYSTGYFSNYRVVKGTAVYTTTFTPPTAPLTAISGTSLLVLQNNQSVNNSVFLDNSTNNFLVTRNGNTTQGTFSPYGGNWSNYFNGSSDYLNVANNTALMLGAGNFTIECWFYITGNSASNPSSERSGQLITKFQNTSNYYTLYVLGNSSTTGNALRLEIVVGGSATTVQYTGTIAQNQWQHFAAVRNGSGSNNITLYLNGTSVATGTNTATDSNTGPVYIGYYGYPSYPNYFNGYISNARIVKGTAVYTSNFTPSTSPLTPITNTNLLTCQSNRFVDNSINNFAITLTGSPTVQRFSPFNPSSVTATSYSGYFDGNGDYLSLPSNAVFSPGTSEFTIEFWYYPVTSLTNAGIFDTRASAVSVNGILIRQADPSGLTISAYFNNATFITSGTLLNLNAWNHVAIVRNSSNSVVTYVNGIGGTGATISTNLTDGTSNTPFIGRFVDASASPYAANGYISNFRMVKGVAVYTGNFTVPTSPLQSTQSSGTNIAAITGTSTSLLTLQSPTFIDNSTNNFTISAFGNSQPTIQNPFGFTSATTNGYTVSTIGGSGYFDGTGDYINTQSNVAFTFGTGDLTLEGWIYQTATSSSIYRVIFGDNVYGSTGGYTLYSYNNALNLWKGGGEVIAPAGTITLNAWNHVAWTRSGSSNRLFINGTQVGATTTDATNYTSTISYIGASVAGTFPFAGYITDARIIKGQALYTSNFVPPSAPLTAVQNTVLLNNMTSAGIYDAAMMNNMETVGGAQLSTAVSKFGGSSMSFDGTGDWLFIPRWTGINASENLTMETWIYMTASPSTLRMLLSDLNASNANQSTYWTVTDTGMSAQFGTTGGTSANGTFSFSANTWYHIALVRNSNVVSMYVNGTSISVTNSSQSASFLTNSSVLYVGRWGGSPTYEYIGYMDDLRITKGIARYTSNFTPPTTAFPIY